MNTVKPSSVVLIVLVGLILGGCGGLESFPYAARAGDTVALAVGWKKTFNRDDLTITITPSSGAPIVYAPGNAAVRAVINLYPDPLSYLIVGSRTGQGGIGYRFGSTYGSIITGNNTNGDPDWWQTSIFIDLPESLPTGATLVSIQSSQGEYYEIPVEIIPGQGAPQLFKAESLGGGMNATQLRSMERARHHVISFTGDDVYPAAIQVDLTHDPDINMGGAGKPFVIDPRGEMKNISWTGDGVNMRVILVPAGKGTWSDPYREYYEWNFYKFYVTGGVTNVQVQDVSAYDIDGNLMEGVIASVDQY